VAFHSRLQVWTGLSLENLAFDSEACFFFAESVNRRMNFRAASSLGGVSACFGRRFCLDFESFDKAEKPYEEGGDDCSNVHYLSHNGSGDSNGIDQRAYLVSRK